MKEHNLLHDSSGAKSGDCLCFGNINKSNVYDDLQKFDRLYRFWRSTARPGRQPGRAHHQGPRQVHPGAGDEHFQNKYDKMVSEDALR
jgi:hypothetical protein